MTSDKDVIAIKNICDEMFSASINYEPDKLYRLYIRAKSLGYEFEVKSTESIEFKEDVWLGGNASYYTEVIQDSQLLLGTFTVYKWQEKYYGHYGGVGAGWYTVKASSNLDTEIEKILDAFNIQRSTPNIPRPTDSDKD